MAISKNFERNINRKGVKKPSCFGNIKTLIADKDADKAKSAKKKCGACIFNTFCRDGKLPETKKEVVKK
jgi:hypothetical protein